MLKTLIKKTKLNFEIQKIILNAGWLLFDKFIRLMFGLLVGVWIARYLGPGTYGQLAYIVTLVSLFQVVVSLGMDTILVREITCNKNEAAQILGSAIFMRFIVGCISIVLLIGGVTIFNGAYFGV